MTIELNQIFCESAKIHIALRGCDEVLGLSNLSLQEEFDQVQAKGLLPVIELQQSMDSCFQTQSIIDGIQTYAWFLMSTDLPPSGEK